MRTLTHWSREPLGEILPRAQHALPDHKPQGLWLSVDGPDDWPSWCHHTDFYLEGLRHHAVITLAPNARVLMIETPDALCEITERYHKPLPGLRADFPVRHSLDWQAVAQNWQGILIPQYLWSMRLNSRHAWYYSWDCASGCIWNPEAIAAVERQPIERESAQ